MIAYPYQDVGSDFAAERQRSYIADEMGMGKTVQAILAARKTGAERILTIAPARTLPGWRNHWRDWGDRSRQVAVTSYTYMAQNPHQFVGADWDLVILDEAHYAKNPNAQRTVKALSVAAAAPRSILLSGTPMPNNATELWAPVRWLWPQYMIPDYQTWSKWRDYFCHWGPTKYGFRVYGHKNTDRLRAILRHFMIRRKSDDVLDLPPLRVTYHELPRDEIFAARLMEQAALVEAYVKEDTDEGSASRLRRLLGTLKARLVADQLAWELQQNMYPKLVVMYYHRDVGDTLEATLQSYGTLRLDGRTRDDTVEERFQTDPDKRVFLGQMTAAGVGLNLQVASEVALVEPDWTPDGNRQAIKRIHRLGQDRPCRARVFGVADTLDAAIMGTVARKTNNQIQVGLR